MPFPESIIFQQDWDTKHTAKNVKAWLYTQKCSVLEWSALRSDLDPIPTYVGTQFQGIATYGQYGSRVYRNIFCETPFLILIFRLRHTKE